MSNATQRLAILKCKDINPLFDLIEDITHTFTIKECITKSNNTCFVVEASIEDNIKIYEILNNLEVNGDFLDCRFVDSEMVFLESKEVNKVSDNIDNKVDDNIDNKDKINNKVSDNIDNKESDNNNKESDIDNKINYKDKINNKESDIDNNKNPTFDLHDKRFIEIYTNDDFIIDTSHDDYKKCSLLKYFIEAKRNYKL